MKYAILDKNGNQIQWCDDSTVFELPPNAVLLNDEAWENRLTNIKPSTADKINNKKRDLIAARKVYLSRTLNDAIEALLEISEYSTKAKRNLVKEEIKEIETAKTLKSLEEFNLDFE